MEFILFLIWLTTALVAFGLAKGTWRSIYEEHWQLLNKKGGFKFLRHDYFKEFSCYLYAVTSPIGLILLILAIENGPKSWRLCYRMPDKYWSKDGG